MRNNAKATVFSKAAKAVLTTVNSHLLFHQGKPAEALASYREFLEIAERLTATDLWWQVEAVSGKQNRI